MAALAMTTEFNLTPPKVERQSVQHDLLIKQMREILSVQPASLNLLCDEYDRLGRNISAQERRQELEHWVLVNHKKNM
jgi:hypothetical protein